MADLGIDIDELENTSKNLHNDLLFLDECFKKKIGKIKKLEEQIIVLKKENIECKKKDEYLKKKINKIKVEDSESKKILEEIKAEYCEKDDELGGSRLDGRKKKKSCKKKSCKKKSGKKKSIKKMKSLSKKKKVKE